MPRSRRLVHRGARHPGIGPLISACRAARHPLGSGRIVRILLPALLFGWGSVAPAVELRVATFNIGAHWGGDFFDYSLGDPGTPDHEAVRGILARIDADVVALQEIHSVDLQGNPNDVQALAASLGYLYLHVPPVTGVFDTSLRVVILSRHPFLMTDTIGSPPGAREITRLHPVVKVDVPGTDNDPLIVSTHLKAGTTTSDRFRRAIEMRRLTGYLSASGLTDDDNYIILGDFNPSSSNTVFTEAPSGLPGSFVLGSDIGYPVSYSTNPLFYFTTPSAARLDPRQPDGSASTYGTTSPGGPVLDLILVSPALAARPLEAEVYNSVLDASNDTGLPKAGEPLTGGTSAIASDHYAVFADLELDENFPDLALTLSLSSVTEGPPDGAVTATVALPAVRAQAVTVTLVSDDPGLIPLSESLLIPAGALSASVDLRTPRNFRVDAPRDATLTASASGYDPAGRSLMIEDGDGPYVFTAPGQRLTERFDGFTGGHDPAPWATGGAAWQGLDDGSSHLPGWRAYGSAVDAAPGFLPAGQPGVLETSFVNGSAMPLTALLVAFDAGQWRSAPGGTADELRAELVIGGEVIPLQIFAADTGLPPGAVPGGAPVALEAAGGDLFVPPGASFGLRFSFVPGEGGGAAPDEIFLNEFHYDNAGTDAGEFIEIVVAPGFGGELSDIDVALYNGNNAGNGVVYGTLNLAADFQHAGTYEGYRIFIADLPADGIQNGPRDGFAIVNRAAGQVLQFLSYEGSFTAGSGPAAGMTATDIGVSQNSEPVGMASLGLAGSGGLAADFAWTKFAGPYTKGAPNAGQAFVLPAAPSQGLAVDNVSVTFLPGELDSDGDGQSDADEIAFGTDPFDAASVFRPQLVRVAEPEGMELVFPGAEGIDYTVQFSVDLIEWDDLSTHPGAGQSIAVPLPVEEPRVFFRVKVGE